MRASFRWNSPYLKGRKNGRKEGRKDGRKEGRRKDGRKDGRRKDGRKERGYQGRKHRRLSRIKGR
jgi:hypothetical protein